MRRLLLIVFIVFALQVEAQTVVYAYNQNGGCISRVLRITESKKSPGKVNKDEMLDEITSRVYFSKVGSQEKVFRNRFYKHRKDPEKKDSFSII